MDEQPRTALRDLIARYGASLADDPRRVEALLRDLVGEHPLEIALIETAAREGIGTELRSLQGGSLSAARRTQLVRQLTRSRGLAADTASWAVETWAAALDVKVARATARRTQAEKKRQAPRQPRAEEPKPQPKPKPKPAQAREEDPPVPVPPSVEPPRHDLSEILMFIAGVFFFGQFGIMFVMSFAGVEDSSPSPYVLVLAGGTLTAVAFFFASLVAATRGQ